MTIDIVDTTPKDKRQHRRQRGWNLRILNADPMHQRAARRAVRPESNSANGRKGFEVTAARYGRDFIAKIAAAWRRTHPTALEQTVDEWLTEFCVSFRRDERVAGYYCDRIADDFRLVVEIDCLLHGEDRPRRDRTKDSALRKAGWRVLRLSEAEIKDATAKELLDRALHSDTA